uniref:FBA_2 domain-containing protein n=1 Tax=Caenorhabditis tropicalis TaxID=1561998 RepID=A0A1I7UDV2_9PELO
MPRDLKMKVSRISISKNVPMKLVTPIIDESSGEMQSVWIQFHRDFEPDLDHEFIKKSKILRLEGFVDYPVLPFLQILHNQTVEFADILPSFRFHISDDFIVLIRSWVETNKPLGTCFTFIIGHPEEYCIQVMNLIRERIEGVVLGDKCVDIPMSNSSILRVSYASSDQERVIKMDVVSLD